MIAATIPRNDSEMAAGCVNCPEVPLWAKCGAQRSKCHSEMILAGWLCGKPHVINNTAATNVH